MSHTAEGKDLACLVEFRGTFEPQLLEGLLMLQKGESSGSEIHHHQYEAIKVITRVGKSVEQFVKERWEQLSSNCFTCFFIALFYCKTACSLGRAKNDVMETAEGYSYVAHAREMLEFIHTTATCPSMETFNTFASPSRRTASVPLFSVKSSEDRKSFFGTGVHVECLLFMASALRRFSDNEGTMAILTYAEELCQSLSRRRTSKDAVAALHEDSKSHQAALQAQLGAEEQKQRQQLANRLAEKRGRKTQITEAQSGTEVEIPPCPMLLMETFTTYSLSSELEKFHRKGYESDVQARRFEGEVTSTLAHAYKHKGDDGRACLYSHISLRLRLDELGREWIDACLSLVEYYLTVLDLSHAEHCLRAVEVLTLKNKIPYDLLLFHFLQGSLKYHLIRLMGNCKRKVGELEGTEIALFLNPNYVPEELRNVGVDELTSKPWSSPARIPFPDVPGFRSSMKVNNMKETALQLHADMEEHFQKIDADVTIDTECEKFLHMVRMRADSCCAMRDMSIDVVGFSKRQLSILAPLYSFELNATSFRNVLRQADYDSGVAAQTIAENTSDDAEKKSYLEEALTHFVKFGDGFRKELEAAKKSKTSESPLEGSDIPSYVVGEMRRAQVLLRLGKSAESLECFEGTQKFIAQRPASVKAYPELGEQFRLCKEMISLLSEKAKEVKKSKK